MRKLTLMCTAIVLAFVTGALGDRRSELIAEAREILALDNVEMRHRVGVLFELADLYLADNETDKAMRLYEQALRVDSLNFAGQVKHAGLLLKNGQRQQAVEKLQLASQYAEAFDVITQARFLLAAEGVAIEPASPASNHSDDPVLYIVPIGELNQVLLEETAAALADLLGLNVIIADKLQVDLGPFDRTQANKAIRGIAARMQENMSEEDFKKMCRYYSVRSVESANYETLRRFVKAFLKDLGPVEEYETFCRQLEDLEKQGQYDTSRLLNLFRNTRPYVPGSVGHLYVTDFDLYAQDSNFLFGTAMPGFGLISYHRFTAAFNEAAQNRPRLVQRTVKQAVSSTFFMLGIQRCSTPMCMRAYPNSLDEHDAKQDTLCTWCTQQLQAARVKRQFRKH